MFLKWHPYMHCILMYCIFIFLKELCSRFKVHYVFSVVFLSSQSSFLWVTDFQICAVFNDTLSFHQKTLHFSSFPITAPPLTNTPAPFPLRDLRLKQWSGRCFLHLFWTPNYPISHICSLCCPAGYESPADLKILSQKEHERAGLSGAVKNKLYITVFLFIIHSCKLDLTMKKGLVVLGQPRGTYTWYKPH